MRRAFPAVIPPGQSWPQSVAGDPPTTGPFNWLRIHNRTPAAAPADVVVGFGHPPRNDPADYWEYVASGRRIVRNLGGDGDDSALQYELSIVNVSTVNQALVWVEVSDRPIVDISADAPTSATPATAADGDGQANYGAGAQSESHGYAYNGATWDRLRDQAGMAPNKSLMVSLQDGNGAAVAAGIANFGGNDNVGPQSGLSVGAVIDLWNGGALDRARSISPAGDGLGVLQAMPPGSVAPAAAAPAPNVAAVITFAAVPGQAHRLTMCLVSYSGAPTGGQLVVADGAVNILVVDITASGPFAVPLPPGGLKGSVNTAMTITLAAAGVAVSGKVSAAKLTA